MLLKLARNQFHYRLLQYQKPYKMRNQDETKDPSRALTLILASLYVLSGVTQPLIMTLIKEAGISDPRAQLYMLFYYLGPASVGLSVKTWPSPSKIGMTALIAMFDLSAQAMNYTGSTLAGPTIFSIIYSSVTVWTAIFSFLLLQRRLSAFQWLGVVVVFGGLCIMGLQSVSLGKDVIHGSLLVFLGSCMHALTYVMSEGIMHDDHVSIQANCAIQGIVCCISVGAWQLIYTRTHLEEVLLDPLRDAGTSWMHALLLLLSFGLSNFVHSLSFFFTLRHFPGGSTSAGVMKGLQAVLVFVVTSVVYCGRLGGSEMCFSSLKLTSLLTVVSGVAVFGHATEQARCISEEGYEIIVQHDEREEGEQQQRLLLDSSC